MIISVKINNCFVFSNPVELSLKADMRSTRFFPNVHELENVNLVKTLGLYGQNNVGKSCLLRTILEIKNVILNRKNSLSFNIFSDNLDCKFLIRFYILNRIFDYSFEIYPVDGIFNSESLAEIIFDSYGNEKEKLFFYRKPFKLEFKSKDKELENAMEFASNSNLLIHVLNVDSFQVLKESKEILTAFANKIEYVNLNNISLEKSINMIRDSNLKKQKIVNFMKNADVFLENWEYDNNPSKAQDIIKAIENAEYIKDEVNSAKARIEDQASLVSTYKGQKISSLLVDSSGTKKIQALAGYIIEALEEGKILLIDELDSGIHFTLAREIISIFNNELNTKAQMIFTTHDVTLMDLKYLFRKEQIWFIDKDENEVALYSLAEFTAGKDGVRAESDIVEKYRRGAFGAIPNPDLFESLLEAVDAKE